MRRLLKYACLLAVAAAIGGYFVLAPDDEDILPTSAQQGAPTDPLDGPPFAQTATRDSPASIVEEELQYKVAKEVATLDGWQALLTAHPNGVHAQSARAEVARLLDAQSASTDGFAAMAALSPTRNDRGYGLFQRLEALGSNAQSASAKVGQLLFSGKAPASRDPEGSNNTSPDANAASEPNLAVQSPSGDAVPATAPAAVSHDESQDAKPMDRPIPSAPPAATDSTAESQLAALAPDGVCQRDEDRLAQLRNNPSRDEAARFANELGCEKLRPQVLALIESLEPAPAAPNVSSAASPGAQTENETAHPSAGLAGANVGSSTSEETCKRDEERLVRLGSNPSGDEALRFVKELGCEKLLPQLQRLLHSPDFDASAPRAPADPPRSNPLLGPTCASERAALDRLRQEPSAEAAGLFWRNLQCEGLRPQVRLLLESLNVAPNSVGSAAAPGDPETRGATSDTPTAIETDPTCRRETAELNRVRATPDLNDAERFASAVTCGALKPQVARLLESLGE